MNQKKVEKIGDTDGKFVPIKRGHGAIYNKTLHSTESGKFFQLTNRRKKLDDNQVFELGENLGKRRLSICSVRNRKPAADSIQSFTIRQALLHDAASSSDGQLLSKAQWNHSQFICPNCHARKSKAEQTDIITTPSPVGLEPAVVDGNEGGIVPSSWNEDEDWEESFSRRRGSGSGRGSVATHCISHNLILFCTPVPGCQPTLMTSDVQKEVARKYPVGIEIWLACSGREEKYIIEKIGKTHGMGENLSFYDPNNRQCNSDRVSDGSYIIVGAKEPCKAIHCVNAGIRQQIEWWGEVANIQSRCTRNLNGKNRVKDSRRTCDKLKTKEKTQ